MQTIIRRSFLAFTFTAILAPNLWAELNNSDIDGFIKSVYAGHGTAVSAFMNVPTHIVGKSKPPENKAVRTAAIICLFSAAALSFPLTYPAEKIRLSLNVEKLRSIFEDVISHSDPGHLEKIDEYVDHIRHRAKLLRHGNMELTSAEVTWINSIEGKEKDYFRNTLRALLASNTSFTNLIDTALQPGKWSHQLLPHASPTEVIAILFLMPGTKPGTSALENFI